MKFYNIFVFVIAALILAISLGQSEATVIGRHIVDKFHDVGQFAERATLLGLGVAGTLTKAAIIHHNTPE